MNKINVFISSTCYDLSQIRSDISSSIAKLGYNPILSESTAFPIDPSKNILENCIGAVENHADIFVLIVGNRYGKVLDNGKSITNLEFKAAQQKGIPIYVFIAKSILNIIPVYKTNTDADYSTVVDNPQIFQFVCEVREGLEQWCFGFENADDISQTLTQQFAHLFHESLIIRNKINENPSNRFYRDISSSALKIILERDGFFEYEFLAQVLVDEIEKYRIIKQDYDNGIIINTEKTIKDDEEFIDWYRYRIGKISKYIDALNKVLITLIPFHLKEQGVSSDLAGLNYAAHTYGRIAKEFAAWVIDTRSFDLEDQHQNLQNLICDLTSDLIDSVWAYPYEILSRMKEIIRKSKLGEQLENTSIILHLELDQNKLQKLNREFERFSNDAYKRKLEAFN
jgi:hypothetical protein